MNRRWLPGLAFVVAVLGVLTVPALSPAQSLGSVAKKERERREKNKEKGVVSHEYTEQEVFGDKADETDKAGADSAEGSDPKESDSPLPDSLGPPTKTDAGVPDQDVDRDKEARDRRRSEAEWKARMAQARANVSAAKERVQFFSELYLAQGERYVDENGNTVVSTPAQLQSMTRKAKEQLAVAEKALADLQEEARHAGVPPGWLR